MAMGSMADAMLKAGLISEDKIVDEQKKDQAKKDAEQKKRLQEQEEQREKECKERAKRETDFEPFNNLWNGDGHKFLAHLVRAFLPPNDVSSALLDLQVKEKTCCICRAKVVSKATILKKVPEISTINLEMIVSEVSGKTTPEDRMKAMRGVLGDMRLAVVSEASRCSMCPDCYFKLHEWLQYRAMWGDREVNRIIRSKMLGELS